MKKLFALLAVLVLVGCGAPEVAYEEVIVERTIEVEVPVAVEVPVEVIKEYGGSGGDESYASPELPGLEQRKIVYRATLHADSHDLEGYRSLVSTQLNAHFGYVESEVFTEKKLEMVLRVPSEALDDFLTALKQGGEVTYFTKTSEDITNTYTTYEARKAALEARHQRLIELIEVAETVEDIIELERERSDVESELTEIGIRLTSYDSLVDYSTVTVKVDFVDLELLNKLPVAEMPEVRYVDKDKSYYELNIANRDEDYAVDLNIKVYDQDELVYDETHKVLPLFDETVRLVDLKSDTTYKIKYVASRNGHEDSKVYSDTFTTLESFGDKVINRFEDTWEGTVSGTQGFILFLISIIPLLVIGVVLYFPIRYFVKKNDVKNKLINSKKNKDKE